jgi:peptidylprolyl isomerase
MSTIASGDLIQIHYTSRSLEGSVIETSDRREPLGFRVGSEEIISALSLGVIGMHLGDCRTITAPPERAFGRHNPDLIQAAPISTLPEEAQVGDQLTATIGKVTLDVWIQKMMAHEAVVDANHPLAGETLVVDVKVVGHEPGSSAGT